MKVGQTISGTAWRESQPRLAKAYVEMDYMELVRMLMFDSYVRLPEGFPITYVVAAHDCYNAEVRCLVEGDESLTDSVQMVVNGDVFGLLQKGCYSETR